MRAAPGAVLPIETLRKPRAIRSLSSGPFLFWRLGEFATAPGVGNLGVPSTREKPADGRWLHAQAVDELLVQLEALVGGFEEVG